MVDPERLLWVPGQRTIFIPPPTLLPAEEFLSSVTGIQIKLIAMELHRREMIDAATLLKVFEIPNTNKVTVHEMWWHGDVVPRF